MNPLIAAFIFACGIAGLFYLDRDKAARPSKALWLPVIYLWIVGSRSVSSWLNITPPSGANVQLDGSPLDAAIFGILLIASVGVLIHRSRKTFTLLAANWPILIYFIYCLISIAWSSHPDVSLKRWIKSLSDITVALIVVTDRRPIEALKRLISRIGFILLPTSLLLIKYFDTLGRAYTPIGQPENTGVTTNKNTLGVVLLVITLATLWHIITLVRDKGRVDRRRRLIAHGVLLAFAAYLLHMASSATSTACTILGGGLILATNHRAFRNRASRVQLLCLALVLVGGLTFFFAGQSGVAGALGRSATLSGRTDIWAALFPTVPNALLGAGFESYWIGPGAAELWRTLGLAGWWHPEILVTEAHNGYIEVYLNLGWVGVSLIAVILVSSYRRAIAAFRREPLIGSLMLAYVVVSAVYSITEAGFRSPDPMWIFLLVAIICSTGVSARLVVESPGRVRNEPRTAASLVTEEAEFVYRNEAVS